MDKEIMVSVICNAYNQEKYIAQTLESFVTQKTNFPFEVLVHDDASTDGTTQIIRSYAEKYPEIVKPYIQTENQYSQHIPLTRKFQYSRAKGKYLAWCEGDDYWTDPFKLQKQVDALEQHPEIDICANCTAMIRDGKEQSRTPQCKENKIFTVEEVIRGGGSFVSTNSLMYRRSLLDSENDYTKLFNLDFVLQISGSIRGGMLYLADCMSAYRVMAEGSWSSRTAGKAKRLQRHLELLEKALNAIDEGTDHRYTKPLQARVKLLALKMLARDGNVKALLSKEGRKDMKTQPFVMRCKLVGLAFYRKIRKK